MPDSASERLNAHLVKWIRLLTQLFIHKNDAKNKKKKAYQVETLYSFPQQKELCNEMESKLHAYTDVKNAIHRMLEGNVVRGSGTEHSLSILEQKWASVLSKVQERKVIKRFA